jgi:hypothetical protein
MVVDDLNVMGIARAEAEYHLPWAIDGNGPVTRPVPTQLMQPYAAQVSQITQALCGVQLT